MKNSIKGTFCKFGFLLFLAMFSIAGKAQVVAGGQYTMSISSATATTNTIDVSLSITVTNPSSGMRFGGFSTGINYNTAIVNGGTITASYVGGKSPELSNLNTAAVNTATAGQIRLPVQTLTGANGVDMAQGTTLSLGTYRITNSASWATGNASLWLQNVLTTGKTNSVVNGYPYGATTPAASYNTTITTTLNSVTVPTLILGHTQAAPYSLSVGQICASSASQTATTGVTCFGGNNGTSTITLSPVPTVSSISYTVDGGSSQSATLVNGVFTVTGLTAGTHAVVISNTGCSNLTATGVSVNGPSQLTNTTTASSCDSYTWSVTGQTYTSSGTYNGTTTNGNGCTVNETLNLTINHSSTTSETQVACDSYAWHGTTYTTSGTYTYTSTNASGCNNVATLHLTINHSSTTSETQVACDSYTWHGTTYTTSGDYTYTSTNASGCDNVATLHLTINNSSATSETQVACGSYTWNGTTYTTSGTYTYTGTNASGCNSVATLYLTINSNEITTQPTAPVICKLAGATATVSVEASNASGATYQWFTQAPTATVWSALVNNANYSGVNTSTMTITRTTTTVPVVGTKYRVQVSGGSCGTTVTSNQVALVDQTVLSKALAPTISTKLAVVGTTCEGTSVDLALAAGTIGNIQLQSSTDGMTWNNVGNVVAQSALNALNPAMTFNTGVLTETTRFRIMALNGVCTPAYSTPLVITVSITPDAGAISGGGVTVCAPVASALDLNGNTTSYTNSTILTLTGSSAGATIIWQKSINYVNATNATPTWTAAGSTTTGLTVTNLAATTWYRAQVTNGACVVYTDVVSITVTPTAKAGVVTSPLSVCYGGDITFTSAAYTGSSIAWEVSTTSATAGFTAVSGETGMSYTMTNVLYTPLSKFYVRSVVTSGGCTIARSAVKTVTVDALSVSGTVTGAGTVCLGGTTTLKLSGNVGTIQWQYSVDGSNYVNVPTATLGSASTFSTTSANGTSATYVLTNVTSDTYFRAAVKSGTCSVSYTNPVQVVIGTEAIAGTISAGASTVCAASGTTLTLSGSIGSIVWQKAVSPFTTWTTVAGATSTTLSTGSLTATTAYKAVVTIGTCSTVETSPITISVSPAAKGGVVAVNTTGTDVCVGSSKSMKVTGNVGTIQWQMSTTSATDGFVDVLGATTTPYTFNNITQSTWFRVVATSGVCTATSASNAVGITVTTVPAVAGTISGVNSVCAASGTTLTLSGSTGSIVWQKAVSPFTTWTAITGQTATTLATGNLTATTAYRAILTSGSCSAITDAYQVTVSLAAKATAISGNASNKTLATAICSDASIPLTLASGYIGSVQWQYYNAGNSATVITNTSSVTWTDIDGATSAVYNAGVNQVGNIWYRVKLTSGPCSLIQYAVPVNVWYKSCVVKIASQSVAFKVQAYPNPYAESFKLNLTTSSEDKVNVLIYDMTGKLVDQREVTPTEVSELQVGDRYPSGVYNVIVTQGENTKTLRVIKR